MNSAGYSTVGAGSKLGLTSVIHVVDASSILDNHSFLLDQEFVVILGSRLNHRFLITVLILDFFLIIDLIRLFYHINTFSPMRSVASWNNNVS